MQNAKGQTTMLELLVGTMLVLVVLVAILNSFQNTFSNAQSQSRFAEFSRQSDDALQALLNNPGITTDNNSLWEKQASPADVNRIGLASSPLLLSEEKVRKFKDWTNTENPDYNVLSQKLGLGNYDFSVTISVADPNCPQSQTRLAVCDSQNHSSCYDGMGFTPENDLVTGFAITLNRSATMDSGYVSCSPSQGYNISNAAIMVRLKVYAK
jgi:type II secretory pathway pseudopilin PulG